MSESIDTVKNITQVCKDNLCMQCGTCYAFCPKDNIEIVSSEIEKFIFKVKDADRCRECGICHQVCPGHTVDFKALNETLFSQSYSHNLIGNFLSCYVSQSTDMQTRQRGASGGTVSALFKFALDAGIIDGALVVRMGKNDPLKPDIFIARNKDEIQSAAQSKYCPVPMNVGLKQIADSDGKFAVVGLPCHIHGIRNAQRIFPKLKKKIVFIVGLLCGPGPSFLMTDHLLRRARVKQEDVAELKYREGNIWPGGMLIKLKNGTEKFIPLQEWLYAQTLFNRYRCSVCMDFAGEFSDISLGDAHFPEFWRNEKASMEDGRQLTGEDGWNLVISRTGFGESLLKKAKDAGIIELIKVSSQRALEAQRNMLQYKKNTVFALNKILKFIGAKLPVYIGIKQQDKLAFHDYFKALVVILSRGAVKTGLGRFVLEKVPKKFLMYKIGFRQNRISRYIKEKSD